MLIITRTSDRITLELRAIPMGANPVVLITGGNAHLGAVSLAAPGQTLQSCQLAGHRDSEVSNLVAAIMARMLACPIAVICGIHFERITREEINLVKQMSESMAMELARELKDAEN